MDEPSCLVTWEDGLDDFPQALIDMITRWRPILETCAVAISYGAVAHALYDQTPATRFTTIPLGMMLLEWLD